MQHIPGEQLHHFHGGLRLRHNKKIACRQPIADLPLSKRYVIPLSQHAGAPATSCVSVGDQVLKYQPLAENPGIPGARVHAPSSGRIEAIERHLVPLPGGPQAPCIVLQSDGRDEPLPLDPLPVDASADVLLARMDAAGIVGLGGAVFSTAAKVDGAARQNIHTLVLNGAECEPYIACDEMLMREQPERIVRGAQVLHRLLGTERVIIAIEDQMGAVKQAFDTATKDLEDFQVTRVTTIYPEGGERQLIEVLTGEQVPADGFPQDMGLLVQNVGTVAAVADAVLDGRPLIERVVTVTGPGIRQPGNVMARIGTPVRELIEACGGYREDARRLIMGGPLMGVALASDQVPVSKAFNCALVLREKDIRAPQPAMPCINCGECVRVCPAQLLPQELYWYIRSDQYDEVEALNLSACIECGCCDFICPSHIPLVDYYRYAKDELRQRAEDRTRAELAKARFDARTERLARIKAERKAAREKKKKALAQARDKQARIAAAVERSKARREQTPPDDTGSDRT